MSAETPNLDISPEAIEHVRKAISEWRGDGLDLALALVAAGYAMLLMVRRPDLIEVYEQAGRMEAFKHDLPEGSA